MSVNMIAASLRDMGDLKPDLFLDLAGHVPRRTAITPGAIIHIFRLPVERIKLDKWCP
jgi:hypothetical protein